MAVLQLIKNKLKNLKTPLYRNSVYISLASLATAVAGFLFWTVAARLYRADDVGVASAIVSAINLVFTLSMMGMNFAIIKFYPKYKEKTIGSAIPLTSISALFFSVFYGLFMLHSESFGATVTKKFFAIFVAFSIVGTLYNIFSIYAIAKRQAHHSFIQSILFSGRFVFLFLLVSFGIMGIVSSFGLGLLLGLVYALIFVDGIVVKPDKNFLKDAFRFSLGNYIANIANVAPNYIMPTIVLTMLGKEEAAYYYIAFTIGSMILLVPNAINTSFFVEGSHGLKDMKATLKKAIVLTYLYLVVANIGIWLLGEFVLGFFGEGYVNGRGLLKIVTFSGFFVVPVNFSITVLNLQGRVREVVVINVLKSTLFLGLSYLLMPRFGIDGVGWGVIGAYIVTLILLYVCFV
ncbi:lipopolysaccharide biosynthesis protein [Thermococcus prieurii]